MAAEEEARRTVMSQILSPEARERRKLTRFSERVSAGPATGAHLPSHLRG